MLVHERDAFLLSEYFILSPFDPLSYLHRPSVLDVSSFVSIFLLYYLVSLHRMYY
jgi:hypothetical protein